MHISCKSIINSIIIFLVFTLICSSDCLAPNLRGRHGEGYYLDVTIGDPPQIFQVVIDTGSSNFAIAAYDNGITKSYYSAHNSSTFKNLHRNVSSHYIQGTWYGTLGSDILQFPTLFPDIEIRVDVSEITNSQHFFIEHADWQGILGLAYPDIARPDKDVSNWIDVYQNKFNYISIAFLLELCGSLDANSGDHYGRLEVLAEKSLPEDAHFFTAPLVKDWYYQITLTDISVNGVSLQVPCKSLNDDKTIIDSGSTNLNLPEKVYNVLIATLNNYTTANPAQGILTSSFWAEQETSCFDTPQNWNRLPNISLSIAQDKNSYFVLDLPGPSYVRRDFTSESREIQFCYKVAIDKSTTGTVLGVVALEGYTIIFNRTAKVVSITQSDCGPKVGLHGPYTVQKRNLINGCNSRKPVVEFWTFMKLCLIPVIIILVMMVITAIVQVAIWFFKGKVDKSLTSNVFMTLNRTQLINED